MRRLYPQVLKAEHAIQELRTELKKLELEGRGQHGKLNEADHEIQDLRGMLGAAERQQADFLSKLSELGLQGGRLRSEHEEAEQGERELSRELYSYWSENQSERKLLEQAAQLRKEKMEEISKAEMSADETAENLKRCQDRLKDLDLEYKAVAYDLDGLEGELDGAQFESRKQRKYLMLVEQECATQYSCNCDASAQNSLRSQNLEKLEVMRAELERRLQTLENAEQEADDLSFKIHHNQESRKKYNGEMAGVSEKIRLRKRSVFSVQAQYDELIEQLSESEVEAERLRVGQLQEQEEHAAKAQAELKDNETSAEMAENKLHTTEQHYEARVLRLEHENSEAGASRDSWKEKVGTMSQNAKALQQRLDGLQNEVKHLTGKISALEGDNTSIGTQNLELEHLIAEAKKKPNCTVS